MDTIPPPNTTRHSPLVSDEVLYHFLTGCVLFCEVVLIFGCFSNVVNMLVFAKLGFKDSINISLFGISLADLLSSVTLMCAYVFVHPEVVQYDLPFAPDEVGYLAFSWPHVIFVKITTLLTAFIALERCLCVVTPIRIKSIITTRRVKIFVTLTYIVLIVSVTPIYVGNRLDWKHDPLRNKTIYGLVFAANRKQLEQALFFSHSVFLSTFAFFFITICTAILSVSLKRKSVWRETVTTVSTSSDVSKKDISKKDRKVAKMVVLVSSLFIVCLLPFVVVVVLMAYDKEISVRGKKHNLLVFLSAMTFVPEAINSSSNIFIYYRNSSKYQAIFKSIFLPKGTDVSKK